MRDLRERLEKRFWHKFQYWGYEHREEERIAIVKDHLMDFLKDSELTLQELVKEPDLIHQHYVFFEWMIWSYDIRLFFGADLLDIINHFLQEYGETEELRDYVLVNEYAERIFFEHINQWAEEEAERAATKPL